MPKLSQNEVKKSKKSTISNELDFSDPLSFLNRPARITAPEKSQRESKGPQVVSCDGRTP